MGVYYGQYVGRKRVKGKSNKMKRKLTNYIGLGKKLDSVILKVKSFVF